MARRWRLLVGEPAPGGWNMGVDEALFASAARGADPALRLYRWDGPWLSLGYAQEADPATIQRCRAAGVGLVRRVTGGRAVLHGADLTYAIAAPADALPGDLGASYRLVGEALLRALRALGVDAVRAAPAGAPPRRAAFDCFESPAAEEICVAGRKLAGSAQRRSRRAVLQHGSVRLQPDPAAAAAAAGLVASGSTSLAECGCAAGAAELARAVVRAVEEVLGAAPALDRLTSEECARAARRRRRAAEDALTHAERAPVAASRPR